MWPTFIRRTALSLLGALLAAPLFAQTINPQNQINWAFLSGAGAPTLTCSSTYYNMPYTDTAANVHYFCTVAGWVADASANGTGTTGYFTKWTGSDTVGNGHMDDGVTTPGVVTSSEPFSAQSYAVGAAIVLPSTVIGYTGAATSAVVLSGSPAFTGTPTAPTPASVISTTQIPTTAYVGTWYAPLASPTFTGTASAPTFNATSGYQIGGVALAASNLSNGVTGSGAVALSGSPAFTGTPTAPTPASVISTTQIPTTAYVGTWYAPLASPTFTGTATAPTFNATTGVDCGGTLCLPATATGYTGAGNVVLSASPTLSGTTTIPTLKLTGTNTMTHVPRAYPAWHQTSGTSITTGAPFGPIFWSGEGQTIERLTANFTGTTTCSTAPVIAVFTCTTVACSSPTNIASLTTGTTAGGYDSGALSVSIPSGVFFTAEFTAGACSSKPAIDFAATVRVN